MTGERIGGRLLVASPQLVDPNFYRTVVLLLSHDEEGAVGVVLNRISEEPVEVHLPGWARHLADPPMVFVGGPVEPAVAIGLVADREPADPTPLSGVGLVDLARDPEQALNGPVRVFSGYAGWGPGQLEEELAEGAWIVVDARPEDAFCDEPGTLWPMVLRRQGGTVAMLASYPPDPSLN